MDVVVRSILSQRPWGVIFSVDVLAENDLVVDMRAKAMSDCLVGMPTPGETWRLEGEIETHPVYGAQLVVSSGTKRMPSGEAICRFLAANVPELGDVRAGRLWQAFGTRLDEVMTNGNTAEIAAVVTPTRPQLGVKLAVAAMVAWRTLSSECRLISWLYAHGVEEASIVQTIIQILGDGAVERLEENPYCLVTLLPWSRLDPIGVKVLAAIGRETPSTDPARLLGSVDEAIKAIIQTGNTMSTVDELSNRVGHLLSLPSTSPIVEKAIAIGLEHGAVLASSKGLRAPGCALMETYLGDRLAAMLSDECRARTDWTPAAVAQFVRDRGAMSLHPEQAVAVAKALSSPVACIQGGAGTGKTHTMRAICDVWEASGGDTLLCALSGKAALRLSQATGRLARTIHRTLLEIERATKGCSAGDDGARIGPRTLVVCDEASMIDLASAYRLLKAMPDGARLLMVGDERQLPPVGFGLVYHRLVADERLVGRLTTIHRQSADSDIPLVAASIRRRKAPHLLQYSGPRPGVYVIPIQDRHKIAPQIMAVAADLGERPLILTPTKKGPASVEDLNARFHALNRNDRAEVRVAGCWISQDDPVVHTRNDYARGLFNGSAGSVLSVDEENGCAEVQFDGPEIFAGAELGDLTLAYAMTCHRAQGSQAETVIIALYPSQIIDPAWLYTAVTRAEKQVIIIGDTTEFHAALRRPWASDRRRSGFFWMSDNIEKANAHA